MKFNLSLLQYSVMANLGMFKYVQGAKQGTAGQSQDPCTMGSLGL